MVVHAWGVGDGAGRSEWGTGRCVGEEAGRNSTLFSSQRHSEPKLRIDAHQKSIS